MSLMVVYGWLWAVRRCVDPLASAQGELEVLATCMQVVVLVVVRRQTAACSRQPLPRLAAAANPFPDCRPPPTIAALHPAGWPRKARSWRWWCACGTGWERLMLGRWAAPIACGHSRKSAR